MLALFSMYTSNVVKSVTEFEIPKKSFFILVSFAFLVFVVKFILGAKLMIRKSFFALITFFIYFIIQGSVNVGFYGMKDYTLGIASGIMYGFLYGFSMHLIIHDLLNRISKHSVFIKKINLILALVFFLFNVLLINQLFSSFSAVSRSDIFLIASEYSGRYQAAASYITIHIMVFSFLLISLFILYKKSKFYLKKILLTIIFILYAAYFVKLMLLSQLIGSNNGLVCTIAFFILTVLAIRINSNKKLLEKLNHVKKISIWNFIIIKRRIICQALLLLCLVIPMLFALVKISDFDLLKLRIFNFGDQDTLVTVSLTSRFELLSNFTTQFFYNPIFGNIDVDTLTTGTGSYAHSLPLSLLSHTGLIGFSIFVTLLYYILHGLSSEQNTMEQRVHNFFIPSIILYLYKIYLIVILLGLATVATFFTWLPLWFSLGFLVNHVVFYSETSIRETLSRNVSY